jgi:hypothetical protein
MSGRVKAYFSDRVDTLVLSPGLFVLRSERGQWAAMDNISLLDPPKHVLRVLLICFVFGSIAQGNFNKRTCYNKFTLPLSATASQGPISELMHLLLPSGVFAAIQILLWKPDRVTRFSFVLYDDITFEAESQ